MISRTVFGAGILVALYFGPSSCTPYSPSTSPEDAEEEALTDKAVSEREIRPLKLYAVEAGGGEWSGKIEAAVAPKSSQETGYQRLIVPIGTAQALNCFIYRVPIDAGQAITRMFRAISVGLEFEQFVVSSVEVEGKTPLVFLSGNYVEVMSREKKRGELKVAISPRTDFPVVCTHDERGFSRSFSRIVRSFLKSFRIKEKSGNATKSQALIEEVWKISEEGKAVGFSIFRSYLGKDGATTSLQVGATYTWEREALHTTDRVVLESEDEEGLVRGKWLDIFNTRPLLQIMLERQDAKEPGAKNYRYIGEIDGERLRGEFLTAAPIRGERWPNLQLRRQSKLPKERRESFEFLQYLPAQDPRGARRVIYSWNSAREVLDIKKGALSYRASLDGAGLLAALHKEESKVESTLLYRRINSKPDSVKSPSALSGP